MILLCLVKGVLGFIVGVASHYTPAKKYCNLLVSTTNFWSILINTILFVDFHELPLASKKLDIIISVLCKRIVKHKNRREITQLP